MEKKLVMIYPEVLGKIMYGVFEDSEVEEILDENMIVGWGKQMYWATYTIKQGISKLSEGTIEEALEDFREYLEKRIGIRDVEAIPGIIVSWREFDSEKRTGFRL